MKKKIVLTVLLSVLTLVCYVVVKELTYSPLTKANFNNLFPDYDNSAKKKCEVDLIGFSLHGELFDIFKYELNDMTIDSCYPSIKDNWTNIAVSEECVVSAWQRIPIDSVTFCRCKDVFCLESYGGKRCCVSFVSELSNPTNFYSCLYVNELEYYFFLYCPDKHYLYYVRKNGW